VHQPTHSRRRRHRRSVRLATVAVFVAALLAASLTVALWKRQTLTGSPGVGGNSASPGVASSPTQTSARSPIPAATGAVETGLTPATAAAPTPTPTSKPAPAPKPRPPAGTPYELPVVGSTGFVTVDTALRAIDGMPGGTLTAGQSFEIIADHGDTWTVARGKIRGELTAAQTLINLPDLIPSIVYRDSNAEASVFQSDGVGLPGITGHKLYQAKGFNDKLKTAQFFMPVLFPMAKKIYRAQRAALAHGETLILYESFRPWDVQQHVAQALTALYDNNATVQQNIDGDGWHLSWFIALSVSTHQLGVAIDVTLGKITGQQTRNGRDYSYRTLRAKEYVMQSPIHDLSKAAAAFAYPVSTYPGDAWKQTPLNPAATPAANRLRAYCVDAGLTPLASEWWHYDDWDARTFSAPGAAGDFRLVLPHNAG